MRSAARVATTPPSSAGADRTWPPVAAPPGAAGGAPPVGRSRRWAARRPDARARAPDARARRDAATSATAASHHELAGVARPRGGRVSPGGSGAIRLYRIRIRLHTRRSTTDGSARCPRAPRLGYQPFYATAAPADDAAPRAPLRLTTICAVELRVLGPLEVVGPDGPIAIDGRLERALLAYLVRTSAGRSRRTSSSTRSGDPWPAVGPGRR